MPLALTLAILAAGQAVDRPGPYYGFLWSLADGCYEQEAARPHDSRRICLRREGDSLRMTDYRRMPRLEHFSDCTSRMRDDRQILFACVGRGIVDSERFGRFEGSVLILRQSRGGRQLPVRELWRRTDAGLEIEVETMARNGAWGRFGRPDLLAGWNYWRLTRVDARMGDGGE
jgi:hypothetical protein